MNYLDPTRLREMVLAHRANPSRANSDALHAAFDLLARRIFTGFKFGIHDEEDAIQDAICTVWSKLHCFDPAKSINKSAIFSYFTSIILNHFRALYRVQKQYHRLKRTAALHQLHHATQSRQVRQLRREIQEQVDLFDEPAT